MAVDSAVGGPVTAGWREGTLTRAKELEALHEWFVAVGQGPTAAEGDRRACHVLSPTIEQHLGAAREAAYGARLNPRRRLHGVRHGALLERAQSNLDAAEAQLFSEAPDEYLLGQVPSLLCHVQSHLLPSDPRRRETERIARKLGMKEGDHPGAGGPQHLTHDEELAIVRAERPKLIAAMRAAASAALREQVRLRSFRNVIVVTTVLLTLLAIGVAITGAVKPGLIPLCFAPEEAQRTMVVCPTAQSNSFESPAADDPDADDIDDFIEATATPLDLLVVELIGLTAAAVAAAAAISGMRGSSERQGLPIALACLKLPTGALTAFLGLLLIRGQFVPGLTALDTSAQILAWALVFGYAQQLFTRLVDQQGQAVMDDVRVPERTAAAPT